MTYNDLNKSKTAFIFELDDVIYPEKDYWFQIYYLFAGAIEYTELIDAKMITDFMVTTYIAEGKDVVFDRTQEKFGLADRYRAAFDKLALTAKLPLKLLIYQKILDLLQAIVVDRKRIFILTNGHPAMQLNKIRHTEWNNLEKYLTCYFANETRPKPATDALELLMKEHDLVKEEVVMIENSAADRECAQALGIEAINVGSFF